MRLIDGNKQECIIEELENICINAPEHVKDLLADLKNQPVACDIDAIRIEISEYKDDKIIHAEQNEMIDIMLEIINKHTREA